MDSQRLWRRDLAYSPEKMTTQSTQSGVNQAEQRNEAGDNRESQGNY